MLTSLTLQNFALIDHHELPLAAGFNVITGETGAGKSLLLDALSLCIGGRADTSMVRHGKNSADVYAQFEFLPLAGRALPNGNNLPIKNGSKIDDSKEAYANKKDALLMSEADNEAISSYQTVKAWFELHEREFEDEILIRRQLSSNGRSKAWLNGAPVSLAELKELSAYLVHIHAQHAQQALLKPQFVVAWLDDMACIKSLAQQTASAYQYYYRLKKQADEVAKQEAHRQDRIDLLDNQLADIEPLLAVDYAQIEAEHDELSNIEALMQEAATTVQLLDNDSDEPDVMSLLGRAIRLCDNQSVVSATFGTASEQLHLAQQHISDATAQLTDYAEQQLPDPIRLEELNSLISLGHRLSRKHGLPAADLVIEAQTWLAERDALLEQPTAAVLAEKINTAWHAYLKVAQQLAKAREMAAPTVSKKLVAQLKPLALPNARCEFVFTDKPDTAYNAQGIQEVELLFSANIGVPMQPVHKIASGGELSRMALIMQVLLATDKQAASLVDGVEQPLSDGQNPTPSQPMLVFDEVDVGISGGTAQVVGELLRKLGEHRQLLAITHQAQVAAQAHEHILVSKHHDAKQTTSTLEIISGDAQINELARMSGGVNITEVTREHARSLLAEVNSEVNK